MLDDEVAVEREAVKALRGVGGDREWWIFSERRIGHLRVPVTQDERRLVPVGVVVAAAGKSGPERKRTS